MAPRTQEVDGLTLDPRKAPYGTPKLCGSMPWRQGLLRAWNSSCVGHVGVNGSIWLRAPWRHWRIQLPVAVDEFWVRRSMHGR